MFFTGTVELKTQGQTDMHDITQQVADLVTASKIEQGLATVFAASATSGITTIEYESGALEDLRQALDEIAPANREYKHNLRWRDGNGHSHLRSALMGPSLTIPILNNQLTLGTWQQILYIDFDVRPRDRSLIVNVLGE
ncbi:MAG: secondary thiamine-phosphate synthase enzyme YjbQ [Anaerolineales bacterium]|nr:secondary thiamine-phosphate synthase enzyme YjbQ [Anaerolineales bacterium]